MIQAYVKPGDLVETLGSDLALVISVDTDGYASVLGPKMTVKTNYGKYLKVVSRMPEEAGAALEAAFRCGGIVALSAIRDEGEGEPSESLRGLLVAEIMTR